MSESPTKPPLSPTLIALVVVGVLAAAFFIYWQLTRGLSAPEPSAPVAEAPPPAPPPAPEPELDLPPLEESDPVVREMLEELSEHPRFAAWLTPKRLVRRFVASVDTASRGESPRAHLRFLEPSGEFKVREKNEELLVDPASYARYDRLTEIFLSIDTRTGERLYRGLKPLFDRAYQDLGYPDGDFDQPLAKAIDHILETPIPQGPVELEQRITGFRYRDPALQNLSEAQKHYLRLGPENMRQVHAKLRLMQTALGLTEAQRDAL